MRILFITYQFPYPADSGYKVRVYNTIKELSRDNNIDLICYITDDNILSRLKHMYSFCKNIFILKKPQMPNNVKLERYILNVFKNIPYNLFSSWDREKVEFSKHIILQNNYDVIIAEHLIAAHILYSAMLHINREIPTVIVNHNVENELFRTIAFQKKSFWMPFNYIKYISLKRYERKVISSFNLSITMSEIDKNIFEKMCPHIRTIALPNGVDTNYYYYRGDIPKNYDFYYAGNFNYYPNVDAVLYFIKYMLPDIISEIVDARFIVAGLNPPSDIIRCHDGKNIIVLGYQDDIRSLMKKCVLSVVPLRLGSGTRLKIVEAMSMGIPVVSTKKGAEGLDIENGKNIVIVDSEAEFSKNVSCLLRNRQILNEIACEGRNLVERKYSWSVLTDRLQLELKALNI